MTASNRRRGATAVVGRGAALAARAAVAALAAPAVLIAAAFAGESRASEPPGEFTFFQRQAADGQRAAGTRGAPVAPEEWERLGRAADSFGPPVLGEPERRFLAAARAGRWAEVATALDQARLNVNARDARGGSVLALAARAGQDGLVRRLVARGADLERMADDGFTALGAAAFFGHRSTLRLLLDAGADPLRPGASGQPPLHLAAMAARDAIVKELLARGVEPASLNRARETALELAAERGHLDTMQLFLDAGVDPANAGR